jgi:homopolymeric O-antigen transport system permease protein
MINSKDYDTLIKPRAGFTQINWNDLWKFRELAYILVWRDIKVRYKQTIFGAAWAIFQPFISMIVFSVFFGALVKVPSDNLPYPIFVYAGLLPWTFFSNGLSRASNSLHSESNMISKIYFPRIIVPFSSLGAGILDLAISFMFMLAMMIYYGVHPGPSMILIAPFLLVVFLVSMGVGTLLATLSVTYRDVKYIAPFIIQLWMYASPVIYPVSIVPEKWRWLLSLNPMSGLIDGCRSALFGKPFDWANIGISVSVSIALVVVGLIYFKAAERRFADII